jgi:hypothetical protein
MQLNGRPSTIASQSRALVQKNQLLESMSWKQSSPQQYELPTKVM